MNVRYFSEFMALAKYLNFSLAAETSFITQPVLSRHISALEDELGVKLFIRNKHSVKITDEGRIFLRSATKIIEEYDHLHSQLNVIKSGFTGSLSVGIYQHAIEKYLRPMLGEFERTYPLISLEIFALDPSRLNEALMNDKVDLGIMIRSDDSVSCMLEYHNIGREPIVVAMNKSNPLAGKSRLSLLDLKYEYFVYSTNSNHEDAMKNGILSMCQKHGFEPKKYIKTNSLETLLLAIQNKNMVSLLAQHVKDIKVSNVAFIDLLDDDFSLNVCAAHKKENCNATIPIFIKCCKEAALADGACAVL